MNGPNTYATMAQRLDGRDSLDHFPTPPWATRALCEWLQANVSSLGHSVAWESACAEGYMVKPLREYFGKVIATDVQAYGGLQESLCDFLMPGVEPDDIRQFGCEFLITNPPFRLAREFIERALDVARIGCAFLVRTSFLEGIERYSDIWSKHPPLVVLQFAERVPMHKGKITATGSTATSYCWIVFLKEPQPFTKIDWIGPCRRKLERPGDYEPITDAAA